MLSFYKLPQGTVYAVVHSAAFSPEASESLRWLFEGAVHTTTDELTGYYVGPRAEMITPWSTTAVEIAHVMGLQEIERIEFFSPAEEQTPYDAMLLRKYRGLTEQLFETGIRPEPIRLVEDIRRYNEQEGLALSDEEIDYLEQVAHDLGRPLTDSELFGFSQVNSEHCRHKIFGGTFVIDGEEREHSLFAMIKETSKQHPNRLVSAYKDNVAFNKGPEIHLFSPDKADEAGIFGTRKVSSVLSLKAETHNFPTTVEPFNGAATGSGGEIRDRLAGGRASLPLAGTAVYMTSYTRDKAEERPWEGKIDARPWLYQTPQEILTKASNGASDFGNKFGQPLICGSLLTFEHKEGEHQWGYDKVIMLAGGVGMTTEENALKQKGTPGAKVVVMGGDNYRIGMGGGAVSSVSTGEYDNAIELNAIQRSNPEMQKRVANVIRAMAESTDNPLISIHDHGAGGHLNCLSELVEETGGHINLDALPIGDPSLSAKEVISNESQERMGLLVPDSATERLRRIAERERAPFYIVGETTDDGRLVFENKNGEKPIDMRLDQMFGSAPKTIMEDKTLQPTFAEPEPVRGEEAIRSALEALLQTESVGCKDWLTNKVDRSVTGRVARQQCRGPLQLPLSDLGAVALDFRGTKGIATSIGHAPAIAMANAPAGSRMAIARALTNLVGAPLDKGLEAVSLSANWMWPCRHKGEDARLYAAVQAASDFAIKIGVNIPTGKDSLSMTQKYPDGQEVRSPGTVIISAAGEVTDVRKIVDPVLKKAPESTLIYIDFSSTTPTLGGSALYQTLNCVGSTTPDVSDPTYFAAAFAAVQELIAAGNVLACHDISSGGLATTLLEMLFANTEGGIECDLSFSEAPMQTILFAENCGVVLQIKETSEAATLLKKHGVRHRVIGKPIARRVLHITAPMQMEIDVDAMREKWYRPSKRMEAYQSTPEVATERAHNQLKQPVQYTIGATFKPLLSDFGCSHDRPGRSGVTAAILRDKGTNGEREMAYALHLAGFDVKDIHMSDLMSGREQLDDIRFAVFCGGFSHSDVLGSAKGWAAGFRYNENAKAALERFYARRDTLSLGICNGCQLMAQLGVLYPEHDEAPRLLHNRSMKFESGFVTVEIPDNNSIMLKTLAGQKIGVWVAHGEGRFALPYGTDKYNVIARYSYNDYPGNPNGSPEGIAGLASHDGRHLIMMPHPERSIFPWQCGYWPTEHDNAEVTPWFEAFVNAFNWCRTR